MKFPTFIMRLFKRPAFNRKEVTQPSIEEVREDYDESKHEYELALEQVKENFQEELEEYGKRKKELQVTVQKLEESEKLARMWKPFEAPKELTKGHARALQDMGDTMKEAIKSIADELLRELSNRAMFLDGLERDKPMWCGVGVNMLYEQLLKSSELIDRQEKRKEVKAKIAAEAEPGETPERTVDSLYKNPQV